MRTQSNVFIISVMIFALITSPISFSGFAFAQEEPEEPDLGDSIGISDALEVELVTEEEEVEQTEEEEVNSTINPDTVSNLGQEVSNFVHESRDLFKQQGVETKAVIQDCRDAMSDALPSERQDVRQDCRDNLDAIRDSYKELRKTNHDLFKEFRENMKVFIQESKGLEVDEGERAAALANIESLSQNEDKREEIRELQQQYLDPLEFQLALPSS